jgi:hypothetical protein
MTKLRLLALLAVVALVLLPAIAVAQGGLQPPCRFHGTVQVDGANVADGTVITATIDGDAYTATTTASSYAVTIAQPEGKSYDGKTVTFKIGADSASQTATWTIGGNVAVNLTKGQPPVTPGGMSEAELKALIKKVIDENAATLKGPKGDTGATGPAGPAGPAGKDASSVIGIVAIVLAAIAILGVGFVLMRKQKA